MIAWMVWKSKTTDANTEMTPLPILVVADPERKKHRQYIAELEFYHETHQSRVRLFQKQARLRRPFPLPQSIRPPHSQSILGQSMRRRILPPNPRDFREAAA